jgi:hypothetical protein
MTPYRPGTNPPNPHEDAARLRKAVKLADYIAGFANESWIRENLRGKPVAIAESLSELDWNAFARAANVPQPSDATKAVVKDLLRSRENARELAVGHG